MQPLSTAATLAPRRRFQPPSTLVSISVCRICTQREALCDNPRPEQYVPPLQEPQTMPGMMTQAWNLAASLAAFVADGLQTVSKEEYEARLAICDACPERQGNRCLQCGCRLSLKAHGRAFDCPLQKWPSVTTTSDTA